MPRKTIAATCVHALLLAAAGCLGAGGNIEASPFDVADTEEFDLKGMVVWERALTVRLYNPRLEAEEHHGQILKVYLNKYRNHPEFGALVVVFSEDRGPSFRDRFKYGDIIAFRGRRTNGSITHDELADSISSGEVKYTPVNGRDKIDCDFLLLGKRYSVFRVFGEEQEGP